MSHPFKVMKAHGFTPSGVLQIGASVGQEVEAISDSGADIAILIEPLPEPYAVLKQKALKFPNMTTIQALCSDKTGDEVAFHVADNFGMSSSILKPKDHLNIHPEVAFNASLKLKTITVDDLLSTVKNQLGLPVEGIDSMVKAFESFISFAVSTHDKQQNEIANG